MIIRLIFILVILAALFWAIHSFKKLPPKQRKSFLINGTIAVVVGVVIIAVLTGRVHWLGGILAALVGVAKFGLANIVRVLPFLQMFQARTHAFSDPKISTPFLKVSINVQTGSVSGEIIEGPHAGKDLTSLSEEEMNELESYYKERDQRSYFIIKTLKNRSFSQFTNKQNQSSSSPHFGSALPSLNEAKAILGIEGALSKKIIVQAHRQLMSKLHPDKGGNDFLAAQINNAKEVLLKHIENK